MGSGPPYGEGRGATGRGRGSGHLEEEKCVCWRGGPGGGCNRGKWRGRKGRDDEQETVESPGRWEGENGWQPGRWGGMEWGGRAAWNAGNWGSRRPRGRRSGNSRAEKREAGVLGRQGRERGRPRTEGCVKARRGREETGSGGGGAAGEGCSAPRLSAQGGNVLASPEGHAGVPVVFRGPGSRSLRARDPEGRSPHGGAGVPRSPLVARVAHIPRTGSQASFLPMPGAT